MRLTQGLLEVCWMQRETAPTIPHCRRLEAYSERENLHVRELATDIQQPT